VGQQAQVLGEGGHPLHLGSDGALVLPPAAGFVHLAAGHVVQVGLDALQGIRYLVGEVVDKVAIGLAGSLEPGYLFFTTNQPAPQRPGLVRQGPDSRPESEVHDDETGHERSQSQHKEHKERRLDADVQPRV
jgi:hypothetical protein